MWCIFQIKRGWCFTTSAHFFPPHCYVNPSRRCAGNCVRWAEVCTVMMCTVMWPTAGVATDLDSSRGGNKCTLWGGKLADQNMGRGVNDLHCCATHSCGVLKPGNSWSQQSVHHCLGLFVPLFMVIGWESCMLPNTGSAIIFTCLSMKSVCSRFILGSKSPTWPAFLLLGPWI